MPCRSVGATYELEVQLSILGKTEVIMHLFVRSNDLDDIYI